MFQLIAGPCVIESEEMVLSIAKQMKEITEELEIPYTFKASFDKANRTSINSFRGPGIEEGLRILQKSKIPMDYQFARIFMSRGRQKCCRGSGRIADSCFLVPADGFMVAAAKTGKCINIKKAQFLAPWDMKNCLDKVKESGNENVMLCERGSTFGYNTLVVDMTGLRVMKDFGVPVIFDATHSVQKPGGMEQALAEIDNMLSILLRRQWLSEWMECSWKLIQIQIMQNLMDPIWFRSQR